VNELLTNLSPGARVLDVGCGGGSFIASQPLTVVGIDLEAVSPGPVNFARADAARLPFPDRCFDLVVSNHSLEHFEDLAGALQEIARVVKPDGALYVSVPDATTFSDKLYRWLARGGGHVNPFSSAKQLASTIEGATGLKHVATRTLCTSLSFLNRKNARSRRPRKLLLLGGGTEASLLLFTWLSRALDRLLHTRLSVYGWALYFGHIHAPLDCRTWSNVCVRCGSGHPSQLLEQNQLVRRRLLFSMYTCPSCGARNMFSDDGPSDGSPSGIMSDVERPH